jgi:hypothetical protein
MVATILGTTVGLVVGSTILVTLTLPIIVVMTQVVFVVKMMMTEVTTQEVDGVLISFIVTPITAGRSGCSSRPAREITG